MEGISGMAKLGKGLGMAGAGFGVFSGTLEMFGVVESESAETRRRLGEIMTKIDDLDKKMDTRFDQLDARINHFDKKVQLGFAKSLMFPYYNTLHALAVQVNQYYEAKLSQEPDWGTLDVLEADLAAQDQNKIMEAIEGINSIALGKRFATTNIFEAEYAATFGDISSLVETTEMLTGVMNSAQFNYVLVKTIQLRRPKEKEQKLKANVTDAKDRVTHNYLANPFLKPINYADVENIAKAANDRFEKIGVFTAISAQARKFTKLAIEKRGENAKDYMESKYGGKGNLTRKNPWNEIAFGRQGDQGAGFNKLLKTQMAARDYETKYGSLAQDLKDKYLCDWFRHGIHPHPRSKSKRLDGNGEPT